MTSRPGKFKPFSAPSSLYQKSTYNLLAEKKESSRPGVSPKSSFSAERLYNSLLRDIKSVEDKDIKQLVKRVTGVSRIQRADPSTTSEIYLGELDEENLRNNRYVAKNTVSEASNKSFGSDRSSKPSSHRNVHFTQNPISENLSSAIKIDPVIFNLDQELSLQAIPIDVIASKSKFKDKKAKNMVTGAVKTSNENPYWLRSSGSTKSVISNNSGLSMNRNITKQSSSKKHSCRNVFVINGAVVAFEGFGFENFSNWFGDESLLRMDPTHKFKFSKEIDVSGYHDKEIRLKLVDDRKLVVEAYPSGDMAKRPRSGILRVKERVLLPSNIPIEEILICRTKMGKLVIRDAPPANAGNKKRS